MPVRRAGVVNGIPSSTYAKATQVWGRAGRASPQGCLGSPSQPARLQNEGMSQDIELELAAIEAEARPPARPPLAQPPCLRWCAHCALLTVPCSTPQLGELEQMQEAQVRAPPAGCATVN